MSKTMFLDKCEEYFGTRDFYEILNIERDADEKAVKKAYHRMSLKVHPDRVPDDEKEVATEKFKVLGKIHSILTDNDKKKLYDENGSFEEDNSSDLSNWMAYWQCIFKPITKKQIQDYEKNYFGSATELRDLKKAYLSGKGDIDHIIEMVPFSNCDSIPRFTEIIQKWVDEGEVEAYDKFFKENKAKAKRRRDKWIRRCKEFDDNSEELAELEEKMAEEREKRANSFFNMINNLEKKFKNDASSNKRKAIAGGSGTRSSKRKK